MTSRPSTPQPIIPEVPEVPEVPDGSMEDLDTFARRARRWLAATLPRLPGGYDNHRLMEEDEDGTRARQLQRLLHDGGFAGLCFPKEYGGQGLSRAHQQVFTRESLPYQMPTLLNVPTLSILAATLLELGTEDQKHRHLPRILSGDEIWVQFLSEPSGGSDLAGLVTRAERDGDVFVLTGSKIWSSGAFRADYALCLARTDWKVPKHRGLTMFIVKVHQPRIEVHRIKMVDGSGEFCQEFFNEALIPAEDVIGAVNDGWAVTSRLLFHEREAVGGGSPFVSGVGAVGSASTGFRSDLVQLARDTGRAGDGRARQLVGEAIANERVHQQLVERISAGMQAGSYPPAAGAIPRLLAATIGERRHDIALDIAGSAGAAWGDGDRAGQVALHYLSRQGGSLGGGSNEMQRNIISERVLGMPREPTADRDVPFEEVLHNANERSR